MLLAAGRDDEDRFIAAHEAGVGKNDRLEQIALGADSGDARQIRSDLAAQVTDGMTDNAGGLLAVEDDLAAANVASFDLADQLFESGFLLAGVRVERRQQRLCFLLERWAELRQARLDLVLT